LRSCHLRSSRWRVRCTCCLGRLLGSAFRTEAFVAFQVPATTAAECHIRSLSLNQIHPTHFESDRPMLRHQSPSKSGSIADCTSISCSQRIDAETNSLTDLLKPRPQSCEFRTSKPALLRSATSLICRLHRHDDALHTGDALCLGSQSEWRDGDGLPRSHRAFEYVRQL